MARQFSARIASRIAMFPNGTDSFYQPSHPVGRSTPDAKLIQEKQGKPLQCIETAKDAQD